MQDKIPQNEDRLAAARSRCAQDLVALEKVRDLLTKADERRLREPQDARKWNKVLENLENSLDLSKARYEQSQAELHRLEREIKSVSGAEAPPYEESVAGAQVEADGWSDTMRKLGGLNLEQASQLQMEIDAGEIVDQELEAGLALANQFRDDGGEAASEAIENRRQLALRAAIDKISKRQFDLMSLDEIKLVLACHSLLTSRLEPTPRDQRLRRILDGASKILQKRKTALEAQEAPPSSN